jgi:tRNA dimethylallyltransferase
MDRRDLYDRINQRVDMMMSQGLFSEVQDLVKKGYDLNLKSMQSIGYRHMGWVINKDIDLDTAVSLLKRDTRRYAKRQFTWFRKEPGIVWITPSQTDQAVALVKDFLTSP